MARKIINWGSDEEFILNYKKLKSARKMADFYKCDKSSVLNHAKLIGYDVNENKSYKLSEKDKKEILEAYNKKTSTELAKKYNISRGMVTKLWYDNNLHGKESRVYKIDNQNFFSNIDTEEKAYWLGFIMADGCVYQTAEENKSNILKIGLSANDKQHLEKFKIALGTNKPVCEYSRNGRKYIMLEVSSNQLFDDLNALGCVPRKTHKITWVNLNSVFLQSAFIRGYFDGDGSISKNFQENNLYKVSISISGFMSNLNYFIDFLHEQNIDAYFQKDSRTDKYTVEDPFGSISFKNKKDKYNFLKLIYPESAAVYLDRKYILSNKYKKLFEKNPTSWSNSK